MRADLEHVADASNRPTDREYARYYGLVDEIVAADGGLGSFAVYDPASEGLPAPLDQDSRPSPINRHPAQHHTTPSTAPAR